MSRDKAVVPGPGELIRSCSSRPTFLPVQCDTRASRFEVHMWQSMYVYAFFGSNLLDCPASFFKVIGIIYRA